MPHPAVPVADELLEDDEEVELLEALLIDEELDDLLLDEDCDDDCIEDETELLRLLKEDFDEDMTLLLLLAEDVDDEEADIIELLELIDATLEDDDIKLLLMELLAEERPDESQLELDPAPAELLVAVPPPEHAVMSSAKASNNKAERWRIAFFARRTVHIKVLKHLIIIILADL